MKPRNHLVKQALFRKAGSHKKSEKALRKKENDLIKNVFRTEKFSKEDFSIVKVL